MGRFSRLLCLLLKRHCYSMEKSQCIRGLCLSLSFSLSLLLCVSHSLCVVWQSQTGHPCVDKATAARPAGWSHDPWRHGKVFLSAAGREALLRNTHFSSTTRQLHCNTLSLPPSAELHESKMSEDSLVMTVWAHCTPWRTGRAAFRRPVALRPAILAILVSCFFRVVLTAAGVGGIRGIWVLRKWRAVWDVIEHRPGGSHVTGLTAVWGVCHRLCALWLSEPRCGTALSAANRDKHTHSNSNKNHYHCKSHSTGK